MITRDQFSEMLDTIWDIYDGTSLRDDLDYTSLVKEFIQIMKQLLEEDKK